MRCERGRGWTRGLGVLVLGLSGGALATGGQGAGPTSFPPRAGAAIELEPDAEGWIRAQEVLEALEATTEVEVRYDAGVRADLSVRRVRSNGTLRAAAEDAWPLGEVLLEAMGLRFRTTPDEEGLELVLVPWNQLEKGARRRRVPADFLPELAAHPGLEVETVIELGSLDADALRRSLRTLGRDPAAWRGAPGEEPGTWRLVGPGAVVARIAQLLRELDALAGGGELTSYTGAPLPVARGDFDLGRGEEPLLALVESLASACDLPLVCAWDPAWSAGRIPVPALVERVGSADAPELVELLLGDSFFLLEEVRLASSRCFVLRALSEPLRESWLDVALPIARDEVARVRPRAATMFRVILPVAPGERDALYRTFMGRRAPAGVRLDRIADAPALVLSGPGPELAAALETLERLRAVEEAPPSPSVDPPDERGSIWLTPDEHGVIWLDEALEACDPSQVPWHFPPEGRRFAQQVRLHFSGPLELPSARADSVAQGLLAAGRFVLFDRGAGRTHVRVVKSWETTARFGPKACRLVALEDLEGLADEPASFVDLRVPIAQGGARELARDLEALQLDPSSLRLLPTLDDRALLLQGKGRLVGWVASALLVATGEGQAQPRLSEVRAERDLVLRADPDDPITLLRVVQAYAQLTAQISVLDDMSARLLAQDILQREGELSVAADSLPRWFGRALCDRGYVLSRLHDEEPRLFGVRPLDPFESEVHRWSEAGSTLVAPETLLARPELDAHALVLWLPVEHADARALAAELAEAFEDQPVRVAALGPDLLIALGRGRELRELVVAAQESDR